MNTISSDLSRYLSSHAAAVLIGRLCLGAVVLAMALGVAIYGTGEFRAYLRDRRRDRKAARRRHPSRRVPGRFPDGEFLSDEEWRALGRIQMDSMIEISDVSYNDDRRQP